MMHDTMGAMGWGMGLSGLIGIIVLVLVVPENRTGVKLGSS